jgi:dihydroorotate dehydrogenase
MDLGFGLVEIGTVTPEPQPGNAKPRIFQLTSDEGIATYDPVGTNGAIQLVVSIS